jgi:RsiW-degrading membrane proteinase PrsW (M82 family)
MQRLPDGTVLVSAKDPRERVFERITLAVLVIWIGVMMAIKHEPDGLAQLGAGGILLASAFYQKARGWRAGVVTWVVGAVLLGFGDLTSSADIPWLAISVILIGIWMLARAARRAF